MSAEILTLEKERIVGVALKLGNVILSLPSPCRHHSLISELNMLGVNPNDWDQGFLSSQGLFLTRWQARQLALRNGQCLKPKCRDELFSEDLW